MMHPPHDASFFFSPTSAHEQALALSVLICFWLQTKPSSVCLLFLSVRLQSIKSYFPNDDDFNWNYGIAKVSCWG